MDVHACQRTKAAVGDKRCAYEQSALKNKMGTSDLRYHWNWKIETWQQPCQRKIQPAGVLAPFSARLRTSSVLFWEMTHCTEDDSSFPENTDFWNGARQIHNRNRLGNGWFLMEINHFLADSGFSKGTRRQCRMLIPSPCPLFGEKRQYCQLEIEKCNRQPPVRCKYNFPCQTVRKSKTLDRLQ